MKISVVYNHESERVINLFGIPNREKYGLKIIDRIVRALRSRGHQVKSFEGDKDLISNLEDFMPRVLKSELPGMVFNLSYGIQGQARYTHVPSILEMVGIPYVGSGPLAHSLALDKVVSKIIFRQNGLPTPDFIEFPSHSLEDNHLSYPLIIKPKSEAVSYGICLVHNAKELRETAQALFKEIQQPLLIEQFIEGREINIGLIGNNPPECFDPVEINFGTTLPSIYTIEDKKGVSGREIIIECPATLDPKVTVRAKELAQLAFSVIGCYDFARVDMRLDKNYNLHLLEINSLPSLGLQSSYVKAAQHCELDFDSLINRLVEVANARYFGTPALIVPLEQKVSKEKQIFTYLTEKRDIIKQRIQNWVQISSRTHDVIGIRYAISEAQKSFKSMRLYPCPDLSDDRWVWTFETKAGLKNGTLLIIQMDIPVEEQIPSQSFRREPEWLFGEGIGASRAPLVMTQFALNALRSAHILSSKKIGVLLYADEGLNCQYSGQLIHSAAQHVAQVLVIRPGNPQEAIIVARRGERVFRLVVEGSPRRLSKGTREQDLFRLTSTCLDAFSRLALNQKRFSVSTVEVHTSAFPMKLPHRICAKILMTYSSTSAADRIQSKMKKILEEHKFSFELELLSERPPLPRRKINMELAQQLEEIAYKWEIPITRQTSAWPSAAGLVPRTVPVICGIGPVAREVYMPHEAISRISLAQRTLLLSQFLAQVK